MPVRAFFFLCALLALLTGPAQGEKRLDGVRIDAITVEQMLAALRMNEADDLVSYTDDRGDPQIAASHDGVSFSVRFYGCAAAACTQAQFRVGFDVGDMSGDRKAAIADNWNRNWVFGKSYVNSDGYLVLEHPLYVAGGIDTENLNRNTRLWLNSMAEFAESAASH